MILHMVNKSADRNNSLAMCLQLALPGSAILLIEEAVYSALDTSANIKVFASVSDTHKLYVLEADLAARGISGKIQPEFETVSYNMFVQLCLQFSKIQTWG